MKYVWSVVIAVCIFCLLSFLAVPEFVQMVSRSTRDIQREAELDRDLQADPQTSTSNYILLAASVWSENEHRVDPLVLRMDVQSGRTWKYLRVSGPVAGMLMGKDLVLEGWYEVLEPDTFVKVAKSYWATEDNNKNSSTPAPGAPGSDPASRSIGK